jgi:hypothetical protein
MIVQDTQARSVTCIPSAHVVVVVITNWNGTTDTVCLFALFVCRIAAAAGPVATAAEGDAEADATAALTAACADLEIGMGRITLPVPELATELKDGVDGDDVKVVDDNDDGDGDVDRCFLLLLAVSRDATDADVDRVDACGCGEPVGAGLDVRETGGEGLGETVSERSCDGGLEMCGLDADSVREEREVSEAEAVSVGSADMDKELPRVDEDEDGDIDEVGRDPLDAVAGSGSVS